MSARPRLVEEGRPIGNNDATTSPTRRVDHVMTGPSASTNDNGRRDSSSSLARAMGKSNDAEAQEKPNKNYRLATRLVIGGEDNDHSSDPPPPEPEEMSIDSPTGENRKVISTRSGSHRYVIGGEEDSKTRPQSTTTHSSTNTTTAAPHHYVIGQQQHEHHVDEWNGVERMEGVEDLATKGPLIVMDGANLAYAYADVMAVFDGSTSSLAAKAQKREPDARGIQVAAKYFLSVEGVRVLVVIPTPWLRAKPRPGDTTKDNALMLTPQLEVLQDLKSRGLLVTAPPTDDDDAYCIVIARREDSRAKKRGGGGFVISNDMFRDAVQRDDSHGLKAWLVDGRTSDSGPGRISFAFCDMGSKDDYGDREMDFVPNPRHPLVQWIEGQHRINNTS